MERHPPPSASIRLREFKVNGHRVSDDGEHALALRVDGQGNLIAFAGAKCREITIDGRRVVFADAHMNTIAWGVGRQNSFGSNFNKLGAHRQLRPVIEGVWGSDRILATDSELFLADCIYRLLDPPQRWYPFGASRN